MTTFYDSIEINFLKEYEYNNGVDKNTLLW